MASINIFQILKNRIKANWKLKRFFQFLINPALDIVSNILWTLAILGAAGSVALVLLPHHLATSCVQFLAIVYMLLLLISISKAFEKEQLNQQIDDLKESLDALNHRIGYS
jgi:hypothetical protein